MTSSFTRQMIKRASILTTPLIFTIFGTSVFAQSKLSALQILKNREPQTEWNSRSLLKGDFDHDGVADYAISGKRDGKFVVGIVKGQLKRDSKHWAFEFAEGGISQNSLCSVADARISLEKLSPDEELPELQKLPKTSRGINLANGECDAFHIYYSREKNQFTWWRN